MTREPNEMAALPKSGDGPAYPVLLIDDTQPHLTIGVGQTLCNREIVSGATTPPAFGADGCDTCRRHARARNLTIVSGSPPGGRAGDRSDTQASQH